jgi:hypothetical protein
MFVPAVTGEASAVFVMWMLARWQASDADAFPEPSLVVENVAVLS